MEFIDLVSLIGQAPDHPLLRKHLADAGITKQPRAPEGEDWAYVQFPEQGYEMRFDPLQPDEDTQLYLRSMTAFPKGDATHKPFVGKLPLDIVADELREALIARLGEPLCHIKITNSYQWKMSHLNIIVRFDRNDGKIQHVQVNVPKK